MNKLVKKITTGAAVMLGSLVQSPLSFRLFLVYNILVLVYSSSLYFSWPLYVFLEPYFGGLANIAFYFTILNTMSVLRAPCASNVYAFLGMLLCMLLSGIYDCSRNHWGFGNAVDFASSPNCHPAKLFFSICLPLIWIFTVIPDLKKWTKTIEDGPSNDR